MKMLVRLLLIYLWCALASAQEISLDFNNISLNHAIYALAAFLKINVIVSPKVVGVTSLHIQSADAQQTLLFLLNANGLARMRNANVWYIAPRDNILLIKKSQPLEIKVWHIQFARATDIGNLLQAGQSELSSAGKMKIDARTNIIYIEDSRDRIKQIDSLIQQLDVPVKQIQIEVRLVSIDIDSAQLLGINFETLAVTQKKGTPEIDKTVGVYGLAVVKLADHSLLDVRLSALESAGHAEVLSSPRLFTSNLQTSSIEAGEEVPYQALSASGGTAVEFKKAVLGFKVTPQILPNEHVLLSIQINQDRPNNKMVLGVPTISTRQIITNILAKSEQTIVLGGVYELNTESSEQGIPYIRQIPVLGWLFKERTRRIAKRELLIFVTPKIL